MRTKMMLGLALAMISICTAFTGVKNDGLDVRYGVSESNPSQIELTLKKDYTFTYQDFSTPSKKIVVSGTYQIKKGKILLLSREDVKYHNRWELSKDYEVAKSRKGLTFYTLRKK